MPDRDDVAASVDFFAQVAAGAAAARRGDYPDLGRPPTPSPRVALTDGTGRDFLWW